MVFGVTDGVSTPEEGRELVSLAVKLMSPSPSYPIRGAFDLNKERLVFGVTDGVSTPEEVTPWEGGAHVSGRRNLLFHPNLKHSNSLY